MIESLPNGRFHRSAAICREVIAPLVRADGGELYVVAIEPDSLALHLAGNVLRMPRQTLHDERRVIEPAIHAVAPSARITVTSGANIPEGASRVSSAGRRAG